MRLKDQTTPKQPLCWKRVGSQGEGEGAVNPETTLTQRLSQLLGPSL